MDKKETTAERLNTAEAGTDGLLRTFMARRVGERLSYELTRNRDPASWKGFAPAEPSELDYEPVGSFFDEDLTSQEWAEMAHLVNVASQERQELLELRDKIRRIAKARNGGESND